MTSAFALYVKQQTARRFLNFGLHTTVSLLKSFKRGVIPVSHQLYNLLECLWAARQCSLITLYTALRLTVRTIIPLNWFDYFFIIAAGQTTSFLVLLYVRTVPSGIININSPAEIHHLKIIINWLWNATQTFSNLTVAVSSFIWATGVFRQPPVYRLISMFMTEECFGAISLREGRVCSCESSLLCCSPYFYFQTSFSALAKIFRAFSGRWQALSPAAKTSQHALWRGWLCSQS